MKKNNKYVLTRWSILFAGFLLALMGGVAYTWGTFLVSFEDSFGWSSAQAAMPFTVHVLFFTAAAIIGGKYQDKFGPRIVSLVGALMLFAGYSLSGLVFRIPHHMFLVLTFGIIGGIGCGMVYSCVVPSSRKWFPDKPALAISIGIMGFGLSAVLFAPLIAGVLLPNLGISRTFLLLGVLTGTVSLFASWLIRVPELNWKPKNFKQNSNKIKNQNVEEEIGPGEMIKKPIFYIMWSSFFLVMAGGFSFLTLVPKYGVKILDLSPLQAALAVSLFALFNGLGRPVVGYLADRVGALTIMIPTYLIQGVVLIFFTSIAVNNMLLYLAAIIFGWGFAVSLALFPTLTSVRFGLKNLGVNYGIILTAFGFSGTFSVISSLIYDKTLDFAVVFLLIGIMSLTGMIFSIVLKKRYALE